MAVAVSASTDVAPVRSLPRTRRTPKPVVIGGAFEVMVASLEMAKRAANCSEKTLKTYRENLRAFRLYLERAKQSTNVADITHTDIEGHMAWMLGRGLKPGSVMTRYNALNLFFRWLVAEEILDRSPMATVKAPKVPDEPPPVLTERQLRALLASCEGKAFYDRRDMAIFRLLFDTGVRLSEMSSILVDEIDWTRNLMIVRGKQRLAAGRTVRFGHKAALDINRYLRVRALHPHATDAHLWLSKTGHLKSHSLYYALKQRAVKAGVPDFWPHKGRHAFAHLWLAEGGHESDLMELCGWTSSAMARRYGRALAGDRAREAHKRLSPGDRL